MIDEIKKDLEKSIEETENAVNKTVEEMKTKIDELTKQAEQVEGKYSLKAIEAKDKAVEIINLASNKLQSTWKSINDSEEVKKTINFLSTKTKEVYEGTMKLITDFMESEEFKNTVSNASEYLKETGSKISGFAKDTYSKAMENEKIKGISEGVQNVYKGVANNVNDFLEKPEVKDGIDKAKDFTIDVAEKAVAALKEWLRPENKKDEDK